MQEILIKRLDRFPGKFPSHPIKAIEKAEEIGDTWYLITAGCGIRIQRITKHSVELIVPLEALHEHQGS